jgi:cell division protein FtsA
MLKHLFRKKKKKYIVAVLDIGSTKIICLIAYVKPNGKVNVVGIGHSESSGIKNGIITDKKLAESSIVTAVDMAEKMSSEEIDRVILTFSSSSIESKIISSQLSLPGTIINERDVENLLKHSLGAINTNKAEIIHYSPIQYSLDDSKDIKNPIGLFGYKLKVNLHTITLPVSLVYNLMNCLASCHLDMDDIIISPFASSYSFLTEDERDLGALVIDLGGATTSYAGFYRKKLLITGGVPVGANNITYDIAKILSINTKNAERIKILHGSASVTFADNYRMIDLPIAGEDGEFLQSQISCAELNSIISARVEEIFEMIINIIQKQSVDHVIFNRVILTGGGSLLVGIKELALNIFKGKVRLGKPFAVDGLNLEEENTSFSSAIGTLLYLAEKSQKNYLSNKTNAQKKQSIFKYFYSLFDLKNN